MSKLRKSARGRDCQVRIPGQCDWRPDTVVLAHLNGGGMGRKRDDIHGAFCCASCHDALDGRAKTGFSAQELKLFHMEGVMRTRAIWLEEGLIQCG